MEQLAEIVEIVGQRYFILGFISGFLYGGWVVWSLSGKATKA
ncbi:MAG TPA: hypothetical protein VF699_02160 [Caulobacteraceae bacterium]|jgi:hypothetical protein